MKSHYAQYIEELSEKKVYEDEYGFFIYEVKDTEMYVQEVFVAKEHRRSGIGAVYDEIAQDIGRDNECKYIKGSVITSAKNSTDSLKFQLGLGYKLFYQNNEMIFLIKGIEE